MLRQRAAHRSRPIGHLVLERIAAALAGWRLPFLVCLTRAEKLDAQWAYVKSSWGFAQQITCFNTTVILAFFGILSGITVMKSLSSTALLAALLIAPSSPADAKGCIKGAVAGGVAGHYAGGHSVVGAIGGCLVGRRLARQQQEARARNSQAAQSPPYANRPADGSAQATTPTYSGGAYTRSPAPTASPAPGYSGGAYQR